MKFDFTMSQDSSLPFQSQSHKGENYLFLPLEFPEAGAQKNKSMSPPQAGGGWYAACEWQCVEAHLLLPILISIFKLCISESAFTAKFEAYQLTGK